jgi:hypothetical protein
MKVSLIHDEKGIIGTHSSSLRGTDGLSVVSLIGILNNTSITF